ELPPAPAGVTVTVRLTRDGRPATDGASVRLVSSVGDGEHALREAGPGLFQAEVPAGSYSAVVADAFADAPLTFAGLAVAEGEANEFAFELAPEFEVELTVSPAEPAMGRRATTWSSRRGAPGSSAAARPSPPAPWPPACRRRTRWQAGPRSTWPGRDPTTPATSSPWRPSAPTRP